MSSLFQISGQTVYIPEINLYLDSKKIREYGFISHAHSDHIAQHKNTICTAPTAALLKIRYKQLNSRILPYGQEYVIGNSKIILFPAGHMLGSAQILIENSAGRLLYTGDFRTRPGRTTENYQRISCDVLIMETTFGRMKYKFPDREVIEEQLVSILDKKLRAGITPIVFAYPMGKAQEILHLISHAGIPVAADYSIIRLANVYKKFGVEFAAFEKFRRSEFRNRALVMPVAHRHHRYIGNLANKFTIFVSGWGIDAASRFRYKVDMVLPYSDHADYDELLQTAVESGAREIYCTHGFDDFVTVLKSMGLNAYTLIPKPQLELFD